MAGPPPVSACATKTPPNKARHAITIVHQAQDSPRRNGPSTTARHTAEAAKYLNASQTTEILVRACVGRVEMNHRCDWCTKHAEPMHDRKGADGE